jgi:hypothetical protein
MKNRRSHGHWKIHISMIPTYKNLADLTPAPEAARPTAHTNMIERGLED